MRSNHLISLGFHLLKGDDLLLLNLLRQCKCDIFELWTLWKLVMNIFQSFLTFCSQLLKMSNTRWRMLQWVRSKEELMK